MTRRLLLTSLLILLSAGCSSLRGGQDFWAVRTISGPSGEFVESFSSVNSHAKSAAMPTDVKPFASSHHAGIEIILSEENHLVSVRDAESSFADELEVASIWFRRIAQSKQVKALVTFVDPNVRRRIKKRHLSDESAVIDLYAPADPTQTPSSMVRNALATALHEATHAFSTHLNDRFQEEVRATFVESCFLIDSIQPGDVLHFRVDADQYREGVALQDSRKAANKVMTDMAAVVGTNAVRSSDTLSLAKLKTYCKSTIDVTSGV